jgi:hypothetical protein
LVVVLGVNMDYLNFRHEEKTEQKRGEEGGILVLKLQGRNKKENYIKRYIYIHNLYV